MNSRRIIQSLWLFPLILLSGCSFGPGDVPPLGNVVGQVTLDGKPLGNVRMIFQPEDGGRSSEAIVDGEGNYRLIYSTTQYGAKVGLHRVRFEHPLEVENSDTAKKVAIPSIYGVKSELTQEVKKGKNQIDFALVTPPQDSSAKKRK